MLDVLGLSPAQAACYQALVSVRAATATDLAAVVEMSIPTTIGHLKHLEQLSLISRGATDPEMFTAAPPMVALGALIAKRQLDLSNAEHQLTALDDLYRSASHEPQLADIVDLVHGEYAIAKLFDQFRQGARERVRFFSTNEAGPIPCEVDEAESSALERGVRFEVIRELRCLREPGFLAAARAIMELGYELRIAPEVTTTMLIADDELAILPLNRPDQCLDAALLIHRGDLLSILTTFFDQTWRSASPAVIRADLSASFRQPGLDATDQDLLRLLDLGMTDKSIAHQLSTSIRTLQRRVALLMELADVQSRFQLG